MNNSDFFVNLQPFLLKGIYLLDVYKLHIYMYIIWVEVESRGNACNGGNESTGQNDPSRPITDIDILYHYFAYYAK